MDPTIDDPRTTDSVDLSEAADPTSEPRGRDRSYLAVFGWTLGLLVVGIAFFKFSGGGDPVTQSPQAQRLLVPPTPVENSPPTRSTLTTNRDTMLERMKESRTAEAKMKVRVVQRTAASYADASYEHYAGLVVNGSDRTIKMWKAGLTFYDSGGKKIDTVVTGGTKPIAPGGRYPFNIDHIRQAKGARASMQIEDVQFTE